MLQTQLATIEENILTACLRSRRERRDVTLIAVSKLHSAETIAHAYALGIRHFGENYVQELAEKYSQLPPDIIWHQIGPLQRRSLKLLPQDHLVIHTLDRPALLAKIKSLWSAQLPPILIQVNIGSEPQKAGVAPTALAALITELLQIDPQFQPYGLMIIPPQTKTAEAARPFFVQTRLLAENICQQFGFGSLHLSMGMSQDYMVAIEEGATLIRVGTALFGTRP